MATPSSVLSVAVETQADPASLAQLSGKTYGAIVSAMTKGAKQTTKLMGIALEQAFTGNILNRGMTFFLRGFHKMFSKNIADAAESGTKKGMDRVWQWMGKGFAGAAMAGAGALEKRLKLEKERRKSAAKEIEDFKNQELDERLDRTVKSLGGGAAATVGALKGGDMGGLADVLRGAGQGIRQRGRAAAAAGAKPDAGVLMKMQGMMGRFAASIGTAMASVGALAGGIALVVKVLMDVEAAAKDMNKAFIDSGGALNASLGAPAQTAEDLNKQLEAAQSFMTDTQLSTQWHVSSEEIQGVVKGLNEGGMSVRRLTEGIKSSTGWMRELRNATELALGYGLLLGKSSQDQADIMGKLAFETGTTMNRIGEGMASIKGIVDESTFDMKRFYAAILEATTGMGMYNVRIEQAAGLLKTLSKILGETVAGEFLKSINQTFSDDSMTDKWKHAVLGGMSDMMKMMLEDAADEQRALAKDLEDMKKGKGVDQQRAAAVEKVFGPVEDMAKSFERMSRKEFARRESEARAAGVDPEMINQINKMFDLAQGGSGKGRTVGSMGRMDPTSKLVHQLNEALNVAGLTSLINANDKQLAAIQGALGLSSKHMDMLLRVEQAAVGDLINLKKYMGKDLLSEEEESSFNAMKDLYNLTEKNGKLVDAANGKAIKTAKDLLLSSEQFAEVASKQDVKEDIELAKQISQATKTTANVIKNLMLKALMEIAANTSGLLAYVKQIIELMAFFMPGEQARAKDAVARSGARAMLESGAAAASTKAAILGEELMMLGEELASLGTGPEAEARKKAMKEEVDLKVKQKEALEGYARAQTAAVSKIDDVTGLGTKASDVARAALGETGGSELVGVGTKFEGGEHRGLQNPEAIAADYFKQALNEVDEVGLTDLLSEAFDPEGDAGEQMAKMREKLLGHFSASEVDQLIAAGRAGAEGVLGAEGSIDVESDRTAAATNFAEALAKEAIKLTQAAAPAQGASVMGVGTAGANALVEGLAAKAKQANDFIITKGGDFIASSPDDTIYGTKGGVGSTVQVNIYGGDSRKIYATVREALRVSKSATA